MAKIFEPWFEYLLRNKAIRNFLQNYAEQDWHEVSKLTLLYGILNLGFLDGRAIIPLEKLRDIVANGAKAVTIKGAIPNLNDQLEDLRTQLDDVVLDIQKGEPYRLRKLQYHPKEAVEAAADASALPSSQSIDQQKGGLAAANVARRHAEKWLQYKGQGLAIDPQDMPVKILDRAAAAEMAQRGVSPSGRPASDWRTGDRGRTYSPPGKKRGPVLPGDGLQGADYPSWWGDGENWRTDGGGVGVSVSWEGGEGGRSRSAPRPSRRPPRLAYSVQPEPQAAASSPGQPLWKNDLVTARYVDVPSSGYGRVASPPRVPPQYMPPAAPVAAAPPEYGAMAPCQAPPGVLGPYQAPYSAANPYGNGGPGPQLYVVQPTVAAPSNAAAAAWGPPPHHYMQGQARRPQQQQQQGGDVGRPGWKPIRTAKVTSRVRELVQADRAAARARREARQRAVEVAVALPRPQQRPQQAGLWSPSASPKSPSRPSDIADSLASNPFTAWFITPPQQQQQQLQQQHEQQAQPFQQDTQLQRPPTSGQQQPWAEPQAARENPQHGPEQLAAAAQGVNAAAPSGSGFQSRLTPSQHSSSSPPSPLPLAAAATAAGPPPGDAPLTFYPRVPNAAGFAAMQAQPRSGGVYPSVAPAGAAASMSPSYNPYSANQYGEQGLHQPRRVAWADNPQGQNPGSSPGWLSGPSAVWDGDWASRTPAPAHQQHQQQHQAPPGQWLGQPAGWAVGAPGTSTAAGRGRDWAGQTGIWPGPETGPYMPQPQSTSPRAEVLRAVRPEVVKWSKSWVGDFGHLDGKRFPPSEQPKDSAGQRPNGGDRSEASDSISGGGGGLAAGDASLSMGAPPCTAPTADHGGTDKIVPAVASGGGDGATAAATAGDAGTPAEQPQQKASPEHLQGLAPALLAADALRAAAMASSKEGDVGMYGADGAAAAAAFRKEYQQGGGLTAAQPSTVSSDGGLGVGGSKDYGLSRPGSGKGVGTGRGADAATARERAWNQVVAQVTRLCHPPELGIGSQWLGTSEDAAKGQLAAPKVALSAGGIKWDFDKIVGSPTGITYQ